MDRLNYQTLEKMQYNGYLLREAPERVLQFGQGNFLRAFADYFIDIMNETAGFNGKVCMVQSSGSGAVKRFQDQDCLYTLLVRGQENGGPVDRRRVISAISRCISAVDAFDEFMACAENPSLRFVLSNTTEAGIVYDPACLASDRPAGSFPGKLTQLLYRRFTLGLPGFIILPCELIDYNGRELKRCILAYVRQWELGDSFAEWIENENIFCSTLVDRIVPGYPSAQTQKLCSELGYEDQLMDAGEVYAAWVIEGPACVKEEIPFEKAKLPITIVDDIAPYKQRKVRILNGAHTSFVPASFLAGFDIVRDCMNDQVIRSYMNKTLYEEVLPTLTLPREDLLAFAEAVAERFANPFIDHKLLSISLNSTSKWKERCMPTLLSYVQKNNGALAECMTFSFAAYLTLYHSCTQFYDDHMTGKRGEETFEIRDDGWVLAFFKDHLSDDTESFVKAAVENERMWGTALKEIPGFETRVCEYMKKIETVGTYEVMKGLIV